MKTWIIHFSNLHFCGGDHQVLVDANTEQEAEDKADEFMRDYQYELFSDHFEEANIDPDEEGVYSVESVELFDEQHKFWPYRRDMEKI